MKLITLLTLTYAVLVLQAALAPSLAVGATMPHLVLLVLVPTVLQLSGRQGLLCAAAWGLLSDCLTATCLGADMIAFCLLAHVLQAMRRRSTLKSPLAIALPGAVLMCGSLAGATALRCWHAGQAIDVSVLLPVALTAAYSGCMLLAALMVWRIVSSFFPAARKSSTTATVANRWRMLTE